MYYKRCIIHNIMNNGGSYKNKINSIQYQHDIFKTAFYSIKPEIDSISRFNNTVDKSVDFNQHAIDPLKDLNNLIFESNNKSSNKNNQSSASNDDQGDVSIDDIYVLANRSNLVAKYVGHTAIKTRDFLDKHKGKVIFIDEAYQLFQDDRDWFGTEALTIINTYMSEYPEHYIFIFSGYSEEMVGSLFKSQQGLERRITQIFTLDTLSYSELFQVFSKQVISEGYTVSDQCVDCFKNNFDKFKFSGGSTLRLTHYAKSQYWKDKNNIAEKPDLIFEPEMLDKAIQNMHKFSVDSINPTPPQEMYT